MRQVDRPRTPSSLIRALVVLTATLLLAGLLPAAAGAQTPTRADSRVGLAPGFDDAGTAQRGMELAGRFDKRNGSFFNPANVGSFAFANSDLAFTGNHVIQGNFAGFQIFDISDPRNPKLRTEVRCPGGQHDPTVHGNLLFISVESTAARTDCGTQGTRPASEADPARFRGIRIFDISNLDAPVQVGAVQTCRGSHTHRLVEDINDRSVVYLYNNGTAAIRHPDEAGLNCKDHPLTTDPVPADTDTARWQVEVIRVPVANPSQASIVRHARLFAGADGRLNGLQNTQPGTPHPCASSPQGCGPNTPTAYSPLPNTNTCHDITAYPAIGLAAGACQGNGLLIDISDPSNPRRIDAVADPNFSYWHSANFNNDGTSVMFTDEWGGGTGARCRETDRLEWGANALFRIDRSGATPKLVFQSYYKMPAVQTNTENCVAHQANIVPVPGRDIIVQGWYQGGISMFDWTDPARPFEIGYFDRGPISTTQTVLGGFWSGYWYNGMVYGSEIARGLDAFALTPTNALSANEIAAANTVSFEQHNPMSLRPITWKPSFTVVRALRDQAERAGMSATDLQAVDDAVTRAERLLAASRPGDAAAQLNAVAPRVQGSRPQLAAAIRELAGSFQAGAALRLQGAGRIETAVEVSRAGFGDDDASTVVIARADQAADALAGTPLAVAAGGPILLTNSNALPAATAAEIQRVMPESGTVHVLGGPRAVGSEVETALRNMGYTVERIAGASRVETSVEIARRLGRPADLLITTGSDFADALAAGAAAAHRRGAVLLTAGDRAHPAIDAYVASRETVTVHAIGGPAGRAYPSARLVSGATREDTAVAVATTFFSNPALVGVARRDAFADALTGGAHVGRLGAPMLLTPTRSLHPAVSRYLCGDSVQTALVIGGTEAIDAATFDTIAARVNGTGC